ncbi:MAG: hypothetical protein K0S36_2206 [Nitrosospira multiformis]|nr:hypothetical protein [Nitrosospira multiformis]
MPGNPDGSCDSFHLAAGFRNCLPASLYAIIHAITPSLPGPSPICGIGAGGWGEEYLVKLISLKIGNHRQAINTRRAGQDVVIVIRGRDIVYIGQIFNICLHTDDLVESHEHLHPYG